MPLKKLNKIIATNVLRDFNLDKNFLFKTIFEQVGIKRVLTLNDLGFIVGPIINAGGRLGYSDLGAKLLISDEKNEIKKISSKLIKLNEKRKNIEKKMLNEIDYEKIDSIRGLDIAITTSAKNDDEARMLLEEFNFPFRR